MRMHVISTELNNYPLFKITLYYNFSLLIMS